MQNIPNLRSRLCSKVSRLRNQVSLLHPLTVSIDLSSISRFHPSLNPALSRRLFTTTMAQKAMSALDEVDESGDFKRTPASFRDFIEDKPDAKYPAEPGRYHLYASYACPWASRCLAYRALKGLEDVISISVVAPQWSLTMPDKDSHEGWLFKTAEEEKDCIPDPNLKAKSIRELYLNATGGYSGTKFSVPVLFDKKTNTIVNNESAEITAMLNSVFNKYAKNPDLDLWPEKLKAKIAENNEWIYENINNGVYRCGFATKQEPYEKAIDRLFDALDRAEAILETSRFINGDVITDTDIRLFVTLVRFDAVYAVHFKTSRKLIREYHNLYNYMIELYNIPKIKDTVNMYHIKKHYFGSHPSINPYRIIAATPEKFPTKHDRESKFGTATNPAL